ncbi:GlxA family transcriptional regulator [Paracoccus homiensis]|uniref:Transcriptional regulator GlxA family, contains an amidase domain and an AraC-type DNA-binding HTH domain n=1 Tax=Paracoccus homiensis TaxID=364199 RepID=A0A1I0JK33_9RHOB|nr:helix-turn-helix domain-containing protein [Paracoccus homiensis]SEU10457.1 Transcriptional regulator GlxA family, contains an amidase domain and an AraC-type DNA-binding HTH domain [Paracoccus homiensis]
MHDQTEGADQRRQIALIVYPGFKTLEATGPLSVFGYAAQHLAAAGRPGGYDVVIAAPEAGPVPSDTLMSLEATVALRDLGRADTVLIAGAARIEDALARETALVGWCRDSGPKVPRCAALCTGSFFLAEAGLLDGRRAATHWNYADRLRQRFSKVEVDADAIFVQAGSFWTSAGVTAAIDLTLAFVEQDYGRDIALAVARDMVMYLKRPGGQSQFSTLLTGQMAGQGTGPSSMKDVLAWMGARLDQPLTLDDIATEHGMSVRSLSRAFAAEIDASPMATLESLRCDTAKALLLDTDLPLKTVAFRAGFRTDGQMRKAFRRRFSLSPRDYRARFATAGT